MWWSRSAPGLVGGAEVMNFEHGQSSIRSGPGSSVRSSPCSSSVLMIAFWASSRSCSLSAIVTTISDPSSRRSL
ncbi:MAG: hypothetical protein ACRDN1_13480 [Trebonia sp.]